MINYIANGKVCKFMNDILDANIKDKKLLISLIFLDLQTTVI